MQLHLDQMSFLILIPKDQAKYLDYPNLKMMQKSVHNSKILLQTQDG